MTEEATRPRPLPTHWLALLLSITSMLGILLTLLGYGVALAVEGRFGFPHSAIFSSSLDLFNLGCWGVVQIVTTAPQKIASWNFYLDLLERTRPVTLTIVGMVAGLALIAWVASRIWRRFGATALKFLLPKAVDRSAVISRRRTWLTWLAAIAGFGTFVVVSTPLLIAAGLIAVVALCAMLALIPAMGMTAGESYIDDWVVRPTVCVPVRFHKDRLNPPKRDPTVAKVYAATCVAITRGTEQVARGRVVFATPNAMVLYDPAKGTIRRVSTESSTVEAVGEL